MLYVDPIAASPAGLEYGIDTPERRAKALREMEQLFAYMLLQEMRRTVPQDGLFEESSEMRAYTEMFDDAISREMAAQGQLGIAKMLEEQLRIHDLQMNMKSGKTEALPPFLPLNPAGIGVDPVAISLVKTLKMLPITDTRAGLPVQGVDDGIVERNPGH